MGKGSLIEFALLMAAWFFLCTSPAHAWENQGPDYESSEEFEKSKQEFGKDKDDDKPPVSIRMGDEDELGEERGRAVNGGWGGWGGPMIGMITLDMSALDPMTEDRGLSGFDNNMMVIGGLGSFTYSDPESPGWWRFGGMGFGASQEEDENVGGDDREAEFSLGGGGVFVEYHHPLGARLDGALGGMMGAVSMNLHATGDDLGLLGDKDFRKVQTFFMGYPYGGLSFRIVDWMRMEAVAGYLFMDTDLSGRDYQIGDSGLDMTEGDVKGGPQYMLRLQFGAQVKGDRR